MRRCVMCAQDKEDVTLTQVVPGNWTAFNNYVGVCAGCQESQAYQKLVKQKKIVPRVARAEP